MPQCVVPECGKEFKSNSGLSSHMNMVHSLSRDGTPLPAGFREKRMARMRAAEATKSWHTPEARRKAAATRRARSAEKQSLNGATDSAVVNGHSPKRSPRYELLAKRGIFRCPECMQTSHKRVDFPSPKELGKHRRFKHGVLGRNHAKTQLALERRHERKALTNGAPVVNSNGRVQCPQCPNTFKTLQGLTVHLNRMHQVDPDEPLPPLLSQLPTQELIHANGSTQGTTINAQRTSRSHSDGAALTEIAIALANAVGYIENYVLTTALKYDIPAKQFARRLVITLGEHYST